MSKTSGGLVSRVSRAERRVDGDDADDPHGLYVEKRVKARQAGARLFRNVHRYITRIEYVEKKLLTAQHLSMRDITRLKIVAEINFRKLDKVIPDLKHIEGSLEPKSNSTMSELVSEAQQLGLDVKKLFEDYAFEPGELIDGEAEEVNDGDGA